MNAFTLDRVECKLAAFKGDGETHGDREKKCVDLTLAIAGDYTVLRLVDPDLIDALTKVVSTEDAAGELFDGAEVARRIQRFPKLQKIALDIECIGREVVVEHGIDEKSEIRLIGCVLNKFRIIADSGAKFTVQIHLRAFPDQKQSGLLWSKIHETAIVSVLPPAQKVLSIDEAKPADATPAPDSDRAFPDAIDGTAKPDNWPFPTRPDGDGAGASA